MNYQLVYERLIEKAKLRKQPEGYAESHHIVPKSLGGSNNKDNLVNLTAREHCLAHLLLAKIYGGKMWHAAHSMVGIHKMTSKAYAIAKEKHAARMSVIMVGKNVGRKNLKVALANAQRGGEKHPQFGGIVIAKNIETGKQIKLFGANDMRSKGFSHSKVSNCLHGKRKTHKGHTFMRAQ